MIIQKASSNTLIQAMAPDTMRGRVMAVYSMMFMGMAPLGPCYPVRCPTALVPPPPWRPGGALCFWLRLPSLRVEARHMIVALEASAGERAEATTGAGSALVRRPK
jgi:hypothetical protein